MTRQSEGDLVVDPAAAGNFAAAAVVTALGSADWQISHDVDVAMSDMVRQLEGATELTVLVHQDSVELVATRQGRLGHRTVAARTAFRTDVTCTHS